MFSTRNVTISPCSSAGSTSPITYLIVSCEGIPSANGENLLSHLSLAQPSRSMSTHVSAPHITERNTSSRTSLSG